jgi:pimeloyl-ACP methyl ester carboxylesterase
MPAYSSVPNTSVRAANGIDYAYRDQGEGAVPLVLLQHFRGNLDNWDPALVDALSPGRRVVTSDNAGVGGSTGTTPGTLTQMAHDAIAFLTAIEFGRVDMLGFSIGSFVAQEIALIRPGILNRLILASSAPQGAAGMHGWAPDVIGAVGGPETSPGGTSTCSSRGHPQAGKLARRPCSACTPGQKTGTRRRPGATRNAQYDAVCAWGIPDHGRHCNRLLPGSQKVKEEK